MKRHDPAFDTTVGTRVTVALLRDLHSQDSGLATNGARESVTLSGMVSSEDVRQAAMEIASHQKGAIIVMYDVGL